jgi:hypothetical protein
MILLTNLIFFILCWRYFQQLKKSNQSYAKQMGWFMLLVGISSCFGAVAHVIHYQLGEVFLKLTVFMMNAFSLFSIYFCFRGPYTLYALGRKPSRKYIYVVMAWIAVLLIFSGIKGDFTVIKIHAGLVLLYSLIIHYLIYRRTGVQGSALVVWGIIISFLPIIVHTMKLSFHDWFNYKDIAHVIMIISISVIYKGVKLNVRSLETGKIRTVST